MATALSKTIFFSHFVGTDPGSMRAKFDLRTFSHEGQDNGHDRGTIGAVSSRDVGAKVGCSFAFTYSIVRDYIMSAIK